MMKKAQIATTMTWAVASVIILFLMVGFIIVTTTLSGKRLSGKNEINVEESVENLNSQRELMKILNSLISIEGKEMNVKEAIKLWFSDKTKYESVFESEMKEVLTGFEYEYWDSSAKNYRVRGFRVFIELDKKELFEIESERFELGKCIVDLYGSCINLARIYIPVSDLEMVYVRMYGSQGEKKNEK